MNESGMCDYRLGCVLISAVSANTTPYGLINDPKSRVLIHHTCLRPVRVFSSTADPLRLVMSPHTYAWQVR